jgi:capsular polysaccharide biosynthesis protein
MLGIRRERVVGHAVRADRLVALVPDREQGYDADFLLYPGRHLHADSSVSGSRRRVLVSRSQASHRRLLNEDECAAALRDLGVELLVTDAMSLSEEVALFRSAELVVGAHGAGLTNIVFAPEGAALVELVPSTYWDSIFAQLASVKRQRYAFLRGRTRGAHRLVPPIQHDFEVDVAAAVAAVRNALAV